MDPVETSPLSVRAEIGSVDLETRTFDWVFATSAAVDRYDYKRSEYFVEILSLDTKAVRMERLNEGASVLNAHAGWSLSSQIGGVVPGSAALESGKRLAGKILISAREEVAGYLRDIRDKIIRFASIGYQVYQYRDTGKTDKRGWRILEAIDWEPYEVSLVPIPADVNSQSRAAELPRQSVPVLAAQGGPVSTTERSMDPVATPTPAATPAPAPTDAARAAGAAGAAPAAVAAAAPVAATLAQIREIATAAKLGTAETLELASRSMAASHTLDQVRAAVIDTIAARASDTAPRPGAGAVVFGEGEQDKFQRGAITAIVERAGLATLFRSAEKLGKAKEGTFAGVVGDAGEFRGMTLLDLARECLERRGMKTRGLDKMTIVGRAFTYRDAGGMMGTADFPILLENLLHKVLQAAYATQPDTWQKFCKRGTVSDFRAHTRYRIGAFGVLDDVTQHGEFKNKTLGDAEKASITAGTKGNIIGVTRQLIVNDDLGALTDLATMLGRAAALTIEVAPYALLALNSGLGPTQTDGQPLFHANRANIGTQTAISAAGFDIDGAVMAQQKDPSGNEFVDIQPAILLIARGLKGQAIVINESQYDPDTVANKAQMKPNAVRGMYRDIVGTPRLSGTRRYSFADPNVAPVIEIAFVDGQDAPVIEAQDGWRFDGSELRARMDFGAAVVDFRGAVTNAG